MGVVSMAKDIKKVHPEDLVCYKVGAFVQTFGKDAYILSYLLGYKISTAKMDKKLKEEIPACGFPKRGINKVCAKLEQKKINYVMIDTRNNYEVGERNDNKNLNTYLEILEKAKKYIKVKNRLEKIEKNLLENVEKENIMEKIRKIEEIVYEGRKI